MTLQFDRRDWLRYCAATLGTASLGTATLETASLSASQTDENDPTAPVLSEPTRSVWNMGVEVTVQGGDARGVNVSFPVAIEWPEQQLEKSEELLDAGLRLTYRDLDDGGRLAQLRIPRLVPGVAVRAVVQVTVAKREIEVPLDTTSLVVPERLPAKLRGYLQPSPFIESDSARIIALAKEHFANELPAWERVEAIFDWVRDNVEYKFDETIRTCLEALDAGVGDCEELSSLFIALCRASGIPARAVWIPGHTYPEFMLANSDGVMHWYPCQAAGGNHDFGRMPEPKPILQKGDRFRIPGERQPQRYLKPTLTAQDATGTPGLKWILEPSM